MPNRRKCQICRRSEPWPIPPRNGLARVCSIECAKAKAERQSEKAYRQKTAAMKRNLLDSDTKHWKRKAQQRFNEYIRLRDANEGCISCEKNRDWQGQWHAGHYRTTGAAPQHRYNPDNCHKQCSVCNNYLSGNLAEYRKALVEKIGIERVQAIERDNDTKRMTVSDYKAVYYDCSAKIRQLKGAKHERQPA